MLTRQLYSNATELINGCLEKSPGPVDHWAQVVPAQHRSQPGVDTSSFDLAVKDISSQESLCLGDNLRVSWHHCPVIIYFVQLCQLSNILTGIFHFIHLFVLPTYFYSLWDIQTPQGTPDGNQVVWDKHIHFGDRTGTGKSPLGSVSSPLLPS